MPKSRSVRLVAIGVVALSVTAVVVQRHAYNVLQLELADVQAERDQARRDAGWMRGVQAQVAAAARADAAGRLADEREMVRLREEVARLTDEVKGLADPRVASGGSDESIPVRLIPPEEWEDAGNASPADAMETFYWAALNGELDVLAEAIAFPDDDRVRAAEWFDGLPESIRLEYGSPERLLGLLMAKDAGPLTGMQLLGEHEAANGDVLVRIRFGTNDGEIDVSDYWMRQTADGWRLVVPADAIDHFARHLRPEN